MTDRKTERRDGLLKGNPAKGLFLFAVPLILGNLFQQFYNMTDSIIVGNFVGEDALAAVGASYALTNVFIMIAIGGGNGASVLTAQYLGAGQYGRMKTSISTSCLTFLALSIFLGGFGFFFSGPILEAPFQCRAHVLHLGPAIASGGDTHQLHLRQEFPGQCRAHRAVAPGVDGSAIWNTDAVFYSPSLDLLPTQLLDQGRGDLVVYHHQALSHSSRTSMPSYRTSRGTEAERTMGSSKVTAS